MEKKEHGMPLYLKYVVIGIFTGVANGLFGSGGGTIAVPAMVILTRLDEHKAHATAILVILPLTVLSSYFYYSKGYINWNLTSFVILGGMVGGYIGAKLLNKCSPNILRKLFGVFMIIAAIRMILK